MSVLVIEADTRYAQQLKENLASADGLGLDVHIVPDIQQACKSLEEACPRLIVLSLEDDETKPGAQCAKLHKTRTPLLVLAPPDKKEWCVQCLSAGADECICKPIGRRELLARARVLLRKDPRARASHEYFDGHIQVDTRIQWACRNDIPLHLSNMENRLFGLLLERRGQSITYESLCVALWPEKDMESARQQLAILVHALRNKVEDDPSHPVYIRTRRMVGYYFSPQNAIDRK